MFTSPSTPDLASDDSDVITPELNQNKTPLSPATATKFPSLFPSLRHRDGVTGIYICMHVYKLILKKPLHPVQGYNYHVVVLERRF